jgi:hypothetical protein
MQSFTAALPKALAAHPLQHRTWSRDRVQASCRRQPLLSLHLSQKNLRTSQHSSVFQASSTCASSFSRISPPASRPSWSIQNASVFVPLSRAQRICLQVEIFPPRRRCSWAVAALAPSPLAAEAKKSRIGAMKTCQACAAIRGESGWGKFQCTTWP